MKLFGKKYLNNSKENNTGTTKEHKIFSILNTDIKLLLRKKEKNNISSFSLKEAKFNEQSYAKRLENENTRLVGELKMIDRQLKKELLSYLEPIQTIYSNIDFSKDNQELSYIDTQFKYFFQSKDLVMYSPKIMEKHDKENMIVESIVNTDDKSKDGLIESVISIGFKDSNGKVILPTKVRVYKVGVK